MRTFLRRTPGALIAVALLLLAGCAAERLHKEGIAAIDRGEYELGVADLGQAVAKEPDNMAFRLDYQSKRESAVEALVAAGDTARRAGQPDTAAAFYRRTLSIDPSNDRAHHGLEGIEVDKRHALALEAARKALDRKDFDDAEAQLHQILTEDGAYVPAQQLMLALNDARGPQNIAPRLQARDNKKVTLQLRDAPTKMVFEVLQRESGINFILDKDVKSDTKTSLFVQDVPVEAAIDLVLEQNQLAREILSGNMVLIYPNTPAKQKEYEQQMVRTFYLTNAAPKDVENALKTVLGAKTLFIDERSNVVVIRDTPDAVRMAEKIVASLDIAEPEVMLELEVLEISRSRVQDLGIQYPTGMSFTPSAVSSAASGATAGAGLVLSDLSHQNSNTIGISSISATVNAMKQAGVANTLASPRIRARNKEKAKVLIGSREPVITNSVTPVASGTPVVTGSVQYLDVGLTLEVQPTVYLDGDVGVKIQLEVSSILKQVTTASGTVAYEIGTRNANTLLRLKDGETQILAGLIQDSDTRNFNSIPGLGDIPLLGKLFGTSHTDREKSEVVLSVTPRIIRMQPRPSSDMTEFWYGNESRTRTRPYSAELGQGASGGAPVRGAAAAPAGGAAGMTHVAPSVQQPVAPVAPSVQAEQVSAPLSGSLELPGTGAGEAGGSAAASGTAAAGAQTGLAATAPPAAITNAEGATGAAGSGVAGGGAHSALGIDGPSDAKVGDEFDVHVQVSTQDPITHLRAQLRYDSSALQIVSASTGDAVPAGAGSPTVNTRGVGAQLDVKTPSEDPVVGSGTLMTVRFKALAPRTESNIAAMLNVLSGTGSAVGNASAQPLVINIHQ